MSEPNFRNLDKCYRRENKGQCEIPNEPDRCKWLEKDSDWREINEETLKMVSQLTEFPEGISGSIDISNPSLLLSADSCSLDYSAAAFAVLNNKGSSNKTCGGNFVRLQSIR
mgnify:CR=1 FL=1